VKSHVWGPGKWSGRWSTNPRFGMKCYKLVWHVICYPLVSSGYFT
jgi:hypothetical protein